MDATLDVALPTFPPADATDPQLVDASRVVVALYLRDGHADHAIRDLAAHTGLSERTFYRHFPRKEDVVRPYLQAALAATIAPLRCPHGTLRDDLVRQHGALLDLARTLHAQRLLAVLTSTERLRAVWLQVLTDAEGAFAAVVAERLGLLPEGTRARLAGKVLVAAGRLALEAEHRPPSAVLAECLDLLGPGLLDEEG